MNTHHIYLIVHLICATISVGGHLVLILGFLPKALKNKDLSYITQFEKNYGIIAKISLFILLITGVLMSYNFGVKPNVWFSFSNPIETIISLKLIGFLIIIGLIMSMQLRILPQIRKGNVKILPQKAFHIISITLLGVFLLILGSFIRF